MAQVVEELTRLLGRTHHIAYHNGQITIHVVAAQLPELMRQASRPVLRSSLVAVHADARQQTIVGTQGVDDGLDVAFPL